VGGIGPEVGFAGGVHFHPLNPPSATGRYRSEGMPSVYAAGRVSVNALSHSGKESQIVIRNLQKNESRSSPKSHHFVLASCQKVWSETVQNFWVIQLAKIDSPPQTLWIWGKTWFAEWEMWRGGGGVCTIQIHISSAHYVLVKLFDHFSFFLL